MFTNSLSDWLSAFLLTLPDRLGDEEKVVTLRQGDHVVDHGPRMRVEGGPPVIRLHEEPGVDALRDDYIGQLGAWAMLIEDHNDGFDLGLVNVL